MTDANKSDIMDPSSIEAPIMDEEVKFGPSVTSTPTTEIPLLIESKADVSTDLSPDSIPDTSASSFSSSSDFVVVDDQTSPATRGATSVNKRSKRPQAKPSSALREARAAARQRMKKGGGGDDIIVKDHLQAARDSKHNIRKNTAVVLDPRMVEHKCLWDDGYPEKPERFTAVVQRCQELGLLDRCLPITPRHATKEEVLKIHTEDHVDKLLRICEEGAAADGNFNVDYLESNAGKYDAVYFHPSTYELSLLSTGCTVDLIRAVATGAVQNGMGIVRPPGHHAMKSEYCGYCFFNNVAVAARTALDEKLAERILIVDFDVHHGQATQQQFYDDPRVLYFSTHRYEHGTFWPNLEESDYNFIGQSRGLGFNVNVPLNKTGLGNSEFMAIWHNILLPVAYKFNPDLIIVSAGYDAALGCFEHNPDLILVSAGFDSAMGDEKGEMLITPQFYPHLLWPLMGLAGGKLAVVLEGGYCLQSLAEGAALTLRALLGDPCPVVEPLGSPNQAVVDAILSLTYVMQPYWNELSTAYFISSKELIFQIEKENGNLFVPEVKFLWDEPKPETYLTRDCYPVQSSDLQSTLKDKLDKLSLTTSLKKAPHKVCISYNDIMLQHRNTAEPGHPEKPDRVASIFACHSDFGLIERALRLDGKKATEEDLQLLHSAEHIEVMKKTTSMSSKELYRLQDKYNSIFFNSHSYECALYAAGSVFQVVDTVLNGTAQSGVAIVRPPGHHAEADEACGFCLFNNVALAAKYAVDMFSLKRILIVDWDVHHGNGIQRMFKDDPRVLYISLHRYDYGTFFPCQQEADYSFVGEDAGEGFNVNIPWNKSQIGDSEYLAAFTKIIMPIAYEYNPELVLVSAGFDAARGDPLGGCRVSPECYGQMTHLLSALANGRVILALEGGYNLTSISYSMTMCTKALLGDPLPPVHVNERLIPSAAQTIQDVVRTHSKYWTMLRPFVRTIPLISDDQPSLVKLGTYPTPAETVVVETQLTDLTDRLVELHVKEEVRVLETIKTEDQSVTETLAALSVTEVTVLNNNTPPQ